MRLCMFHPAGHPMERGWVGRIDGDRVIHLAAQTLQSFFLGGGKAREHAEYRLDDVVMLAPVLHPPTVRLFDGPEDFAFANASAIRSPGAPVNVPSAATELELLLRPTAVVGAEQRAGGFTLLAETRARSLRPPKDRDFALLLGPSVLTPDEWVPDSFDWNAALAYAADNTLLRAGDLVSGPVVERKEARPGETIALAVEPLGTLEASIAL